MKNITTTLVFLLFNAILFQSCSYPKKGSVEYYENQTSDLYAQLETYRECQNFCTDYWDVDHSKKYQYDTNKLFDTKTDIQRKMYNLVRRMIVVRKQIPDSMILRLNSAHIETIKIVDSIITQSKK